MFVPAVVYQASLIAVLSVIVKFKISPGKKAVLLEGESKVITGGEESAAVVAESLTQAAFMFP